MNNYLNLRKSGKISEMQYQLLSWYGFCLWQFSLTKDDKYRLMSLAYQNSCEIAGVDYQYIFDVGCNHNYSGLQNFNRLSEFKTIA